MTTRAFQQLILTHYRKQGRKDLPWKKTRDPYKILVSEVMLQQTQVSRVLPKYHEFLQEFPTVKALAKAPDAKLLKVWQGLGYWRRAKYLKAAAQKIVQDKPLSKLFRVATVRAPRPLPGRSSDAHRVGVKPSTGPGTLLESLPGVGPYTAGAVACFAFGSQEPFIDTNIRRVYLHFFFPGNPPPPAGGGGVSDKDILKVAGRTLYKKDPRLWHYALFDYGATVLKDRTINRRSRHYVRQSAFAGSFRSLRTSVVQLLLEQPTHTVTQKKLQRFLENQIEAQSMPYTPHQVLTALLKDNLVKQKSSHYSL